MPTTQTSYYPTSLTHQANRFGVDRRRSYFRSLLYSSFKRRRKGGRRDGDSVHNTIVDVHEPKLAFIFSLTLLLCIADAFLTLIIINNGGEEVNPFMEYLMNKDVSMFFWVKFAITAFGMAFLITHKNFLFYNKVSGYHFFYGIAAIYVVLVNYELVLITQIILRV